MAIVSGPDWFNVGVYLLIGGAIADAVFDGDTTSLSRARRWGIAIAITVAWPAVFVLVAFVTLASFVLFLVKGNRK